MQRPLRAIRGATTVKANEPDAILAATGELIGAMLEHNEVACDDLVCIFLSATSDLTAAFPAAGARAIGLTDVPLFGSVELEVEGALARCVRVMVQCYSDRERAKIRHVYIHGAQVLRADLTD